VSEITTFLPSLAGGLVNHRPVNSSSSKPGEIQSAGPSNNGSFTLAWSGTGYCIVIPTGCFAYLLCRSYCLMKSITQYCHCVESPTGVGIDDPSGSCMTSASAPEDSFATS